jgi:hypothetical protein
MRIHLVFKLIKVSESATNGSAVTNDANEVGLDEVLGGAGAGRVLLG